jgi:hypothetical protein
VRVSAGRPRNPASTSAPKAAATALERDGYLLPEDTKRIVESAAKLTRRALRASVLCRLTKSTML